jgi:hypothetical protein
LFAAGGFNAAAAAYLSLLVSIALRILLAMSVGLYRIPGEIEPTPFRSNAHLKRLSSEGRSFLISSKSIGSIESSISC